MSKNRKRVTTQQRVQRAAASYRAKERRRRVRIEAHLDELRQGLAELEALNAPWPRPPFGYSASIVLRRPHGNEGDCDPRIERFLDYLEADLFERVKTMRKLRLRK